MLFHKIAKFVKRISFTILSWQSNYLQDRLKKKYGYSPNKSIKGCTIELKDKEKVNLELLNKEVREILKKCKNEPVKILNFIEEHGTKVYIIKNAKKILNAINENTGLITERSGFNAFIINYLIDNGFKLKSKSVIIKDSEELSLYYIIHDLHRWCALKNKFPGFEERAQRLLLKINDKNEDKIIAKLSNDDMKKLSQAIARNVQSIDFIGQYTKENEGSKKALKKMQTDGGANI